jgi:hypothetical protein
MNAYKHGGFTAEALLQLKECRLELKEYQDFVML